MLLPAHTGLRRLVILLLGIGVLASRAEQVSPNARGVLTNAAQVRALTSVEAAKKIPVRFRGVLLDNDHSGSFSMMDGTVGIYAKTSRNELVAGFARGDLVEIEGVSNPGTFAPYVDVRRVRKIGVGAIPEPQQVSHNDLLSGRLDAQWIEVSAVVRRVEHVFGELNLEVELENGGGRILAHPPDVKAGRNVTVDSVVRLRGICYYQFTKTRQVLRPYLAIPMGEPILVTEPASANLNALPVQSVESLMQFGGAQMYARRVRVHGVVIHTQAGDGVWIRDGKYGLRVVCIGDTLLGVGTEVDVFGFFARSEFGTLMEDAIVRRTGATASVDPIQLTNAVEALDHDSDLVECEAIIHERWQALDGIRLKLSNGMTEFPAVLRLTNHAALPSQWLPGARIRAVGISSVAFITQSMTPGTLQPQSFQILLRSPADIQILQGPPWWNTEHVAWLTGGVSILLLLAMGMVIWIGRRHLRAQAIERMKSEAEFSAVMNERNRMAREFHDTLAQGLGAISLQLEVAKRQLPADSNAQKPLGEAGAQTRSSLDEVRSAIWNMRSQVLETGDLASALNGVLQALADRNQLQAELKVIGEPKRFAPVVENNLLRIGQEAIANAVKHAQAKRIEVALKFERQQFELRVSDDGHGFDPSHPPASEGGFGLVGMRERAAELHGELNVSSAPEKGCVVKLTMPLSNS